MNPAFWRGRRVLVTGHTGFKGAWLTLWLRQLGAEVSGLALAPERPSLWAEIGGPPGVRSVIGDIRDPGAVRAALAAVPEIVIHMAAQALVRRGYAEPVETFSTNAVGTAVLLDELRRGPPQPSAILVVTSDKVYRGSRPGGFVESDPLGGEDPYSASKAAQEHVAAAFARSFFDPLGIPLIVGRAGNVIGGGDFGADRLIPDIWRAAQAGEPLVVRFPEATRPWQHVLDCLGGYLRYIEETAGRAGAAGGLPADWPRQLNFGPADGIGPTVAEVVETVGPAMALNEWVVRRDDSRPEKLALTLSSAAAARTLGWTSRLGSADALAWTAAWYRGFAAGEAAAALCAAEIERYMALPSSGAASQAPAAALG